MPALRLLIELTFTSLGSVGSVGSVGLDKFTKYEQMIQTAIRVQVKVQQLHFGQGFHFIKPVLTESTECPRMPQNAPVYPSMPQCSLLV